MKTAYTIAKDEHGKETLLHGSDVPFDEQRKAFFDGKQPKGVASVTLLLPGSKPRTRDFKTPQVKQAPETTGLEKPSITAAREKAAIKTADAEMAAAEADAEAAMRETMPHHKARR